MDWKKGDIVICIDDGKLDKSAAAEPDYNKKYNVTVRLNAEYIVQNIYTCPICGDVVLDIGIRNLGGSIGCACKEAIPFKEIRWFAHERFKKKKKKIEIPFLEDEDQ